MAGYLDKYGAGEEQREKLIKRLVLSVLAILILGGALFFTFKNYRQEKQVKYFFEVLRKGDYQSAYRLWGCTETKPCRDYQFDKFMEDWGPKSIRSDMEAPRITKSRSCGTGVILTVDLAKDRQEKLWVERDDLTIGFSPWPACLPR